MCVQPYPVGVCVRISLRISDVKPLCVLVGCLESPSENRLLTLSPFLSLGLIVLSPQSPVRRLPLCLSYCIGQGSPEEQIRGLSMSRAGGLRAARRALFALLPSIPLRLGLSMGHPAPGLRQPRPASQGQQHGRGTPGLQALQLGGEGQQSLPTLSHSSGRKSGQGRCRNGCFPGFLPATAVGGIVIPIS